MRRDERRLMRVAAACAIGLLPAMGQAQASTAASKPLEGRWRVELTLDDVDPRHAPSARDAKGEIAFDSASWWNPGDRWGRHSLDLAAFFGRTGALPAGVAAFSATDTSLVTEVTGRMSGPMATIEFMPRSTRYGITLEGRLVGDSIVGQWHRRGMIGSGTFAMNRLSREPVRVAAVNDPMLNPALRAVSTVATRPAAAIVKPAAVPTRTAAAGKPVPPPAAARVTPGPSTTAAVPATSAPVVVAAATPSRPVVTTPPPAATVPSAAPAAVASGAATPARATLDPSVAGDLRVRIHDLATKTYVSTAYQLQLANNEWMWGDMKTGGGAEGWGPTVRRPAGTHRVVVDNFMCGDKFWFFARPLVRPVEIRPGQATELTIEVDLSAEPAKKSYDNPGAARCSAGATR